MCLLQFIREYTCDLGMEFLQHALQDILLELWDSTESYEVNPKLLTDDSDLVANQERLEALADRVLDRICAAAPLFPYQVAKIYRVLETEMLRLLDRKSNASVPRLSAIGEDPLPRTSDERKSNTSLPRLSSVGEDFGSSRDDPMAATAAAREEFVMHLGGLVFLRFICPALVLPHKMHLTPDDAAPSKTLQRTLVLVAKLFQSLANNTEYGAREDYMMPFNAFLTRNRCKLLRFYDQICQQAQNDNRRESLIARSHAAPRISQLWASTSSSAGSKDAIVNLTGAATVTSPDEYLPVLRQWLLRNVAFVTKDVARDRKHQRRSCGVLVAPGAAAKCATTVATANAAMAKAKSKASKPKRKLKSASHRAPFAHTGDMNVVKEDDDGSDGEDPSSSSGAGDPLERSRGPSAGVSPEELAAVMGHTSHRDIQLMKLYYAKLSQRGLQRLLEAADPSGAHAWTAYKSKHHVSVFRKDHRAVPRFVCPSRRNSERVDRFVEMKASVVVRATPRRVFQYLRSLERMSEWDERAARIEKVEPLDESRVILYRSHPKLSLWPTWLVKPRDSCDLHSFVEKTGRVDTFGVVLESVPRPDVPELKGTVRMSYATGGFLVEPSFSDETEASRSADPAEGAFARLTCVVRADFKGLLPRCLAESICYRQVLSVLAIRANVEAVRATQADSTWV